uniref:Uncharacterized protein n=1 Tax=Lactuca sativa TaxID=4236 RepID=A0A9R1XLF6_LACSA|nr:hypothetical protein LSAT_V11C300126260 [Lactuca sativa]
MHSQSFDVHVGIDLNDEDHFEVPRVTHPIGRDRTKRKEKAMESGPGCASGDIDQPTTKMENLKSSLDKYSAVAQEKEKKCAMMILTRGTSALTRPFNFYLLINSARLQLQKGMPPGVKDDDIGWKHGKRVEGTINWVLCNYCPNVAKGGITRHKHHLVGDSISVCKCLRAPPDIRKLFKDIFEKQKQDKVERNRIPHFDDDVADINDENEEEAGEVPFSLGKRAISSSKSNLHNKKVKGALDTHFRSSTETGNKKGYLVGTPEHNQLHKKLRGEAVQEFARWMYDAGLAFNAVKYDSLGSALEAICNARVSGLSIFVNVIV